MLLESVVGIPSKRLCEIFGGDRGIGKLKLPEDGLKSQRHGFGRCRIFRCGHSIDRFAEFVDIVERLQQRVHVAGGTLVFEANESSRGTGVEVAEVFWEGDIDLHFDDDGIIDYEGLGWVTNLAQWVE